jgi:predicted AAA+ superfamily ATPase
MIYKDTIFKKEIFKLIIKEFQNSLLPHIFDRDLEIPLSSKKIFTIYGPRRCGKSFYFLSLIKKLLQKGIPKKRILYLSFEDDRILPLDFQELTLLLEAYFELYPENKEEEIFLFFDPKY